MIVDKKIVGTGVNSSSEIISLYKIVDETNNVGFLLQKADIAGFVIWEQAYMGTAGAGTADAYHSTPIQLLTLDGSIFLYVVTLGGVIRFHAGDGSIMSSIFWDTFSGTSKTIVGMAYGANVYVFGYDNLGVYTFFVKVTADLSTVIAQKQLYIAGYSGFYIENPPINLPSGTNSWFVPINFDDGGTKKVCIARTTDDFVTFPDTMVVYEPGVTDNRFFGFDFDINGNIYMNVNGNGIVCIDTTLISQFSVGIGGGIFVETGIKSLGVHRDVGTLYWIGGQTDTGFISGSGKKYIIFNKWDPFGPTIECFAIGDGVDDYDISNLNTCQDKVRVLNDIVTFGIEKELSPNSYYFRIAHPSSIITGTFGSLTFTDLSTLTSQVSFTTDLAGTVTINVDTASIIGSTISTPFTLITPSSTVSNTPLPV